ncbi:UDP-glycosyltransferase 87A1 [Heracleum sosnowskyi]|uniref:UDP-glycosyltransferase 87A1 n=1 Tax=Heracleum sosnowskyi TaxID=360622 RepID=A0AAD8N1T5_9APIA|nr:UDP-glycosyltransferase 87A1 [Heracleum sosnowskyi]
MEFTSANSQPSIPRRVVAMPFPGRGHINPMMNLCMLLASKQPDFLITYIVTEEWLGLLSSETELPPNISFGTIPNVIPSELVRAANHQGFVEATLTKMEGPVEQVIDGLDSRPMVIIYDLFLGWVAGVGNRRNIPVASLWPMSATVFSIFKHTDLLVQNGHFPVTNLSEQGENEVDYIPGVPSTRILDLPSPYYGRGQPILHRVLEAVSMVEKSQFLLFTSVYELEREVIDALRAKYSMPVYAIGPAIPYFKIKQNSTTNDEDVPHYIKWLDNQPNDSVLYISQGSFLSVSSEQLDEIVAGVLDSGVSYLWVTKMESSRINNGKGLVVPWCDQLRVLCHPSIGGFWSHCGWNSTKEGVFAGVPMLTLPIMWDQIPNSKVIVEDWKTGWRVKGRTADETIAKRNEIATLVKRFMESESIEGKIIRKRVRDCNQIARQATAKGGTSDNAIDAFIDNIFQTIRN